MISHNKITVYCYLGYKICLSRLSGLVVVVVGCVLVVIGLKLWSHSLPKRLLDGTEEENSECKSSSEMIFIFVYFSVSPNLRKQW